MPWLLHLLPVKARGFKSCNSIGIGNAFALSGIIKAGKTSEFIPPSFCHSLSEVLLEIAEKQKRRVGSELFPHKKQRWRRCEKNDCHSRAHGARIRNISNPFSECTVSYLVMILQERDERGRRQTPRAFATLFAVAQKGSLTLIRETLDQAAAQLLKRMLRIVHIISVAFAGNQNVQSVMDVVIPLRGVPLRSAALFTL